MADIKNPKGFSVNGGSFNEFAVAKKSLSEWIEHGKKIYVGTDFFGRRDEKQQEELLTEVHKIATGMVGKAEAPAKAETKK